MGAKETVESSRIAAKGQFPTGTGTTVRLQSISDEGQFPFPHENSLNFPINTVGDTPTIRLTVFEHNLSADLVTLNVSQFTNDVGYLTTVTVDGITITGDGTITNPLVAVITPGFISSIGDTNTIDLDVTLANLTANVRHQDTATILLSDDGFGLKADFASMAISQFTNDVPYITVETDPIFTTWLVGPPNISIFTNDSGYTQPGDNISVFVNDVPYLVAADVSGFVPYTGATGDVDLGLFDLEATTVFANILHAHSYVQFADASHTNYLNIKAGEELTADRILGIVVNDGSRTLTIAGNTTISNTNTGDQTSIVGISGTMAQFDTANSDGNFVFQSQLGTNVATALAVNVGTAGAFVVLNGALGTPSSGTLTNVTGLPIVAGTTGTLSVARGGTGVTTIAAKSIWLANALDTITSVTPGAGQSIRINAGNTAWEAFTPGGTGTVTIVSVVTANGVSGSVATDTTTPAITLTLGNITPTTVNGLTFSENLSGGFNIFSTTYMSNNFTYLENVNGFKISGGAVTVKTVQFNNSLILAGTDATTMTFPTTSATIARTDAAQTFSGTQSFASTLEIGHASDTTLSRSAAGILAVEGVPLLKSTSGVGTSPTASSTTTITHGLGRAPVEIYIYGMSGFVANGSALPAVHSIGSFTSSGNTCVFQPYDAATITAAEPAATSTTFAIRLDTGVGNFITGIIGNVTATQFDIVWTETGTATAQPYMWISK